MDLILHAHEIPADLQEFFEPLPEADDGSEAWLIANSPYRGEHFALFPSEIPRRCLSLSTSAHGCCASCGAPYVRQTERVQVKRKRPNDLVKRTGEDGTGNVCGNTVAGVAVATTGWERSCQCNLPSPDGLGAELPEVVPCRVLDPFCGAATTGLAAIRNGRDFTGIELSPEYVQLGRKRLLDDNPLFNGRTEAQ